MSVERFLQYAVAQTGAPYIWGGRERMVWHPIHGLVPHHFGVNAFDCWGLCACALKAAGWKDWRGSHNANFAYFGSEEHGLESLPPPDGDPQPGDFLFYGSPDHAAHVEILLPSGELFGAIGGGPQTVKPDASRASVRVRVKQRPDRIGWRRNPLRPA